MSQKDKRFVIQEHTRSKDIHWDLMLETGNILQTYRLDRAPEEILCQSANAIKIFDHLLKFLTYEGPVNKGRGSVRIIEAGTYEITHQERKRIELSLSGKILKGNFTLTHIKDDNWRFAKNSPFQDS